MKHFIFLALCMGVVFLSACKEKQTTAGQPVIVTIENAYAFATMPGQANGAVFMEINNAGTNDDVLVSAKTNLASVTEIHENMIDPADNTMMMRKIENVVIPAQEKTILEPKGKHIMLMKLKQPLTLDSTFPVTLTFENAGPLTIDVKVMPPGAQPAEHDHMHGHSS
jgi:hypothetical protein